MTNMKEFEEHKKRLGTGLLGLVYLKLCLTDIPCGLTALFPRRRLGSSKEPAMIAHVFHVPLSLLNRHSLWARTARKV